MTTPTSKKFKLDNNDLPELARTAAFVGLAAALTWIGSVMSEIDFGQWGPLVVPVAAVAIDGIVKWLRDNSDEE